MLLQTIKNLCLSSNGTASTTVKLELQLTFNKSKLPLNPSNFVSPSGNVVINFTLDKSNFFRFPLKVPFIGVKCCC